VRLGIRRVVRVICKCCAKFGQCYKDVARVLQGSYTCCKGITRGSQRCSKGFTRVFHLSHEIDVLTLVSLARVVP
jgi:hypothetical protein